MADNRDLEGFIHNLSKSLYTEIRGYLQDVRFLHASLVAWWQLPFLRPRVNGICGPIGDKVKPWAELHGTIEAAQRYPATIRSTLESQESGSIIIFGHLEYVGCEGAIDNRKQILPPPRNMEVLHKLDLRGKTDENWQDYHKRKFGRGVMMGSSPTSTQQVPPMSTLHPSQFTPLIRVHFTNPGISILSILHPHADVKAKPDADACTITDGDTDASIDARVKMSYLGFVKLYSYSSIVSETPTAPFFNRVGSMGQPPSCRVENTRWEARMASHSNTEECGKKKTKTKLKVEMQMKTMMEMKISTRLEVKTKKIRTMVTIKWRS
ncbi:hypothetical protein Goarm_022888 [Gossypium armourianum]|uniref:Uncharacterized protein n=1 Tax=Gossypium armourianum TaxID=34283 RepID=A0A7J9KEU5_9ROSI|nr:hypothetical protein [Gossypium armourianum]